MPNYRPGRSSRTGGNAGEQLVSFTMHDAQRINRVVGIVERDRRLPNTSSLPRAAGGGGGGGGGLLVGSFIGPWYKNQQKTVTLTATTTTANVTNLFASIQPGNQTRTMNCIVAPIDEAYYLIAAECA